MSKSNAAGQRPVVEKNQEKLIELFRKRNLLDIPPAIQKDLEKKSLEARWIDSQEFSKNGNMHMNSWEVYFKPDDIFNSESNFLGATPDKTVKRGTLVLAVRPKAHSEAHRKDLQERAQRHSLTQSSMAGELRQMARQRGLKSRVTEGYEEN